MTKLQLTDFTKDRRVKAYVKELAVKTGVEREPRTMVTRRLIGLMLNETIEKTVKQMKEMQLCYAISRNFFQGNQVSEKR